MDDKRQKYIQSVILTSKVSWSPRKLQTIAKSSYISFLSSITNPLKAGPTLHPRKCCITAASFRMCMMSPVGLFAFLIILTAARDDLDDLGLIKLAKNTSPNIPRPIRWNFPSTCCQLNWDDCRTFGVHGSCRPAHSAISCTSAWA